MKRQHRPTRIEVLAVIIATFVFVGVVGWLALATATTDTPTAQKQLPTSSPNGAEGHDQQPTGEVHLIQIKELGIQFQVSAELADLTYSIGERRTEHFKSKTAQFSTKSLTDKHAACGMAAAPLGTLTRTEGTFPTEPNYQNVNGGLLAQYDGYYVGYLWPENPCYTDQGTEIMVTAQRSAFREALYAIQPLN